MTTWSQFDPLEKFAEIERLVSKVYYRFSHLFLHHPELRDFWWQMALDEERHASILRACKEMIGSHPEKELDPTIGEEKANQLQMQIGAYLGKGTPAITAEEAFRIALEIENSEIDVIYNKLLQIKGADFSKILESLGSPADDQRQKLKAALNKFCKDPELLRVAEQL